jgi:hypothetical protein
MLATDQKSTLHELLDQSLEQDQHKADYTGPAREFKFDQNSKIVPNLDAGIFGTAISTPSFQPTDWAWSQIFGKLGPSVFGKNKSKGLPGDYLLALRPEQRAALLNDHLQNTDTNWLLRTFDQNARAVLSDKYTPISNTDLLDILDKVVSGSDLPSATARGSCVSPDSLNASIIFKNIEIPGTSDGNKNWGIGVKIRNGETGNRRGGIHALVKRHSCDNSIVLDNDIEGYSFLHLGSATAKLINVKDRIATILPFAATLLEKLIEADSQDIPDFADVINGICIQHGWDSDRKDRIFQGTEGRETRLGLVNGVTYSAHYVADPDAKSDIEAIGGAILVAKDSVFHQAALVYRNSK